MPLLDISKSEKQDRLNTPVHYRLLIDGQWMEAASGRRFERRSPAHGLLVGTYAEAGEADVNRAVQAAKTSFQRGVWRNMPAQERAALLLKVSGLIKTHAQRIALTECLEVGKPITQSIEEVYGAADLWAYAAGQTLNHHGDSFNAMGEHQFGMTIKEPVGVVGIITPWNFPFIISAERLPFALGAGCSVVLKPSEFTPGTTLIVAELLQEAGLPPGVVNVVSGFGDPAGQTIADHPDVRHISFTGSTLVGRKMMSAAAGNIKRLSLELGGKNPQVVCADVDLDETVDGVLQGVFINVGQICVSGSRLIIDEKIAEAFLDRLVTKAKTIPVGDPLDENVKIGAIINERQFDKVLGYINAGKQSARLLCGGAAIDGPGLFIEPTIFDTVSPDDPMSRNEIFGPVLTVSTFTDLDQAISMANDTDYGLAASVWTNDLSTAMSAVRAIEAGKVWVNSHSTNNVELPFGGVKQSGVGREMGRCGIDTYCEIKTVDLHVNGRAKWWLKS